MFLKEFKNAFIRDLKTAPDYVLTAMLMGAAIVLFLAALLPQHDLLKATLLAYVYLP